MSRNLAELWTPSEPHEGRIAIAALVALGAHLGFAWWAPAHAPAARPVPVPVEVEFAQPEPPPPPAPLASPAPVAQPEPAPAAPVKAPPRVAAPPPAARAAAVMTAAPSAPEPAPSDEPFDFTSDPTSTVLSSGVVAVGGTGAHGLAGAQLGGRTEPVRAPVRGDGLTAASDLSQSPRLRNPDPCRGFFPNAAHDDAAAALVRVVVNQQGVATSVTVISESPTGQGFGSAARTCMLEQRFAPALDRQGRPAATAVNVNVKFSR